MSKKIEDKKIPEKPEKIKKRYRIYKHVQDIDSHIEGVTESLEKLIFSSVKDSEDSIQKKKIVFGLVSFILMIALATLLSKEGKAEEATFYPMACLGGWNDPHKAEGKPETADEAAPFSLTNSASLAKDAIADLYCGSFKGEAPAGTKPTKMSVTIEWKALSEKDLQPIVGESFASSTSQILDATSSSGFTATTSLGVSATSSDKSIESAPSNELTPVPIGDSPSNPTNSDQSQPTPSPDSPQSLLQNLKEKFFSFFAETVYALDEVMVASTTVVAASSTDVASSSTPDALLSNATGTIEFSTSTLLESATTTPAVPVSTEISAGETPIDPVLEVMYTLDGENWMSLGKVGVAAMSYSKFEIPVTSSSTWADISNIQIKVKSMMPQEEKPTILIDGMSLAAEYDVDGSVEEGIKADPKRYSLSVNKVQGDISVDISDDPDQGSNLNVASKTGGSLLVYKDLSDQVVYSSGLGSSPLSINSYVFDPGTFTIVITNRDDGCLSASSTLCQNDAIGVAKFTVTPTKNTPTKYVHTE